MDSTKPRLRRFAWIVLVNFLGVVLLLLLLEGGVRLFRPTIGPAATDATLVRDSAFVDATGASSGLRPGATGQSHGATLTVDADGFLAYSGNEGLADTTAAWLLLGDSVTMGIGVEPDSTFAGRLAERLDTLRVLNPALIGYAADDYARLFPAILADSTRRMARVTLIWCLNDIYPDAPSAEPGQDIRRRSSGLVAALNRHSRLYRLLKAATLDRPLAYYRFDRPFYETERDSTALRTALAHLRGIRDRCATRGVPFEVIVLPYEPQLRPTQPGTMEGDRLPQRVLVEHLRADGISVSDLTAIFAEAEDPARLFLWSDGIHLSARGHARVADALLAP